MPTSIFAPKMFVLYLMLSQVIAIAVTIIR